MSTIAIMQPYFFPYLGYFSLIRNSDHFVFFDTPQYIRKGWVNRNRILHLKEEFNYITVPVKKSPQITAINEILIDQSVNWQEKLLGQFTLYRRKAPYYDEVINLLKSCFQLPTEYLSEFNILSMVKVCDYLGLKLSYGIFSKMNIEFDNIQEPDDWALEITKRLGYSRYINPPGGIAFFNREKYKKNNIELEFLKINLKPYIQKMGHFTEGLSILDVMMFCSPKEIIGFLDDYNLI